MPTLKLHGVDVEFPFEPYDVQKAYMSKVIEALKKREHALLESPTGTGKPTFIYVHVSTSVITLVLVPIADPDSKSPLPAQFHTRIFPPLTNLTPIGKTLSLLCSALSWRDYEVKRLKDMQDMEMTSMLMRK